jgi:hypothetical protein
VHGLPPRLVWRQRPFPDANLLLSGRRPALVDSGFVGHAEAAEHTPVLPDSPSSPGSAACGDDLLVEVRVPDQGKRSSA